jgi:hypothetical protein
VQERNVTLFFAGRFTPGSVRARVFNAHKDTPGFVVVQVLALIIIGTVL